MAFLRVAVLAWSLVVGFAAVTHAQRAPAQRAPAQQAESPQPETAEYQSLAQAAVEEYGLGHWEEARALFMKAHALQPSARTLRGLGMAAFEARQYVDALHYLEAALTDVRKPLTEQQRRGVRSLVERAKAFVVRLHLDVEPPNAQITVDGRPLVRNAQGVVLVDPGNHQLLAHAEGYGEAVRVVDGSAGSRIALEIHLSPESTASPTDASGPVAEDAVAENAASKDDGAPEPPTDATTLGALKWVALAASGAAFMTAGVAFLSRERAAARWNDDDACLAEGTTREALCGDERRAAERWQTVGLVSLVAGGVLAGATAALFALDESPVSETIATSCASGVGEIGIACTLRF